MYRMIILLRMNVIVCEYRLIIVSSLSSIEYVCVRVIMKVYK
jgi:hypothetical protein